LETKEASEAFLFREINGTNDLVILEVNHHELGGLDVVVIGLFDDGRAYGIEKFACGVRSEAEEAASKTPIPEAKIQKRLAAARNEWKRVWDYKYALVNDVLDQAVTELRAIVLWVSVAPTQIADGALQGEVIPA